MFVSKSRDVNIDIITYIYIYDYINCGYINDLAAHESNSRPASKNLLAWKLLEARNIFQGGNKGE